MHDLGVEVVYQVEEFNWGVFVAEDLVVHCCGAGGVREETLEHYVVGAGWGVSEMGEKGGGREGGMGEMGCTEGI